MSSPSPPLSPPTSDSEDETEDTYNVREAENPVSSSQNSLLCKFPRSTSTPHPFAASTNANRAPPLYQKKVTFTPPATPPEPPHKLSSVETHRIQRHGSHQQRHYSLAPEENEQVLWDRAISSAIDSAKPKIDLSGNGLTFIPSSILDLKHLVVLPTLTKSHQITASTNPRPFQRSATVPAPPHSNRISNARRFLPTVTTNALGSTSLFRKSSVENHKSEIELYLMRNAIRVLPRELFGLDCLVVLSLRQNKLKSLPPAIGQLKRLRELNVASNRLAYLPAEILGLRLTSLNLHPNPFTPPPSSFSDPRATRNFGPIERGSSVPTLSEYMLRFLLSAGTSTASYPTRLELSLAQSLESLQLPGHVRRVINASTRHGCHSKGGADAEEDVTANKCPNPVHARLAILDHTETQDGTFCTPVETMVEWVSVVAGIQVAESRQAQVPVLWRGCSTGCLSFLQSGDEETDQEISSGFEGPVFVAGSGEDGELFEFSDEE